MAQKQRSKFGDMLITAVIGTILLHAFSFIYSLLMPFLYRSGVMMGGASTALLITAITSVRNVIAMLCACLFFSAAIANSKPNFGGAIVAGLAAAAVLLFGSRLLMIGGLPMGNLLLTTAMNFAAAFVGGLIYVSMCRPAASRFQTPGAAMPVDINAEELEQLAPELLAAVAPSLKEPLTAVLCDTRELRVTAFNGVHCVHGYVNSQNSFGSFSPTEFSANISKVNDVWVVDKVTVGVRR